MDSTGPSRKLGLELFEVQTGPHLDEKAHRRELFTVAVPADADTATLRVPPDLPPSYAGRSIRWSYAVELDDDAVDLVIDPPLEPPLGEDAALDHNLAGRRSWVERGAKTDGGMNRVTIVGSLALGLLLLAVGATATSVFGLALGAFLLAIGFWFGRDLLVQVRHSLRDVDLVVEETIVEPGKPVSVCVEPNGRDTLEVGLVAVELSLVPHRQTIVCETTIERWIAVEPGHNEIPTQVDDPPSYQGEHIALHWYLAVRDATLPPKPRRLSERRQPITLRYWQLPAAR